MDTKHEKTSPYIYKLTIALRFLVSVDSCKRLKFLGMLFSSKYWKLSKLTEELKEYSSVSKG
jgi:hypothetical protein